MGLEEKKSKGKVKTSCTKTNESGMWALQREELHALGTVAEQNLAFLAELESAMSVGVSDDLHPSFERLTGPNSAKPGGDDGNGKTKNKRGKSAKSTSDLKTEVTVCDLAAQRYRVKVSSGKHLRLHRLELIAPASAAK